MDEIEAIRQYLRFSQFEPYASCAFKAQIEDSYQEASVDATHLHSSGYFEKIETKLKYPRWDQIALSITQELAKELCQ